MLGHFKRVWREYSDPANVLVYQFGKVGSTALESSLPGSIHTHTLYGNSPCSVHLQQRRRGGKYFLGILGDLVKRRAIKYRKEINIITIVREPYSRNISMFFQDIAHWIYKYVGDGNHDNRFAGMEYLESVFYDAFDHEYINNWFDKEIKQGFGIDVFSYPFDFKKRYTIINKGKVNILVLRYEDIDVLPRAVCEFLNVNIILDKNNIGDDKWYGVLYKNFKSKFLPSRKYIENIYDSKYVKHFYTEVEIDNFKNKFLESIDGE